LTPKKHGSLLLHVTLEMQVHHLGLSNFWKCWLKVHIHTW
jgi:hypothetical protein